MKIKPTAKQFVKVFDELGVDIVSTEMTGGNHYKITAVHEGHQRFFIAPLTTSDHRAVKNFRAEIRRWMRHHNEETLR